MTCNIVNGCADHSRIVDAIPQPDYDPRAMSESLPRARVAELLHLASRKRVAVIGDAMLDVYLDGDVERISPEAPVPIVRVRERRHALGGAGNVAQNVTAVGARCELVAVAGDDPAGGRLRQMLAIAGGDASIAVAARCTTQKTRIVARAQQLVRIDEEDDSELSEPEILELVALTTAAVATADAVVLEDYNKGVLSPRVIAAALGTAARRGIPVVVDPKFRNFFAYGGSTVFKPNLRELEGALGAEVELSDPQALRLVLPRLGVRHLLLTLGEHGMVLVSDDADVVTIPSYAREIYDVVGAGDTVSAYLATMLAGGASITEAAMIANMAAGVEVGKLGAATVSPEEVLAFLA